MTNAWIQRLLTLSLLLLALGCARWLWGQYPVWAIICVFIPIGVSGLIISMHFFALYVVNRHDPAPRATILAHIKAWWGELCASVLIFNWWQPFRRAAEPDCMSQSINGQVGIVLIHGFFCNRGFWTPWMQRLRSEGRVCVAVDLEPAFGSIDSYAQIIDNAVRQVQATTGLPPVLVGHSMGGLAIRAWLAWRGADGQASEALVRRVITLGTPHHGTWLGNFSYSTNGAQMCLNSPWLKALKSNEASETAAKFICFYSNCDNIVFPVSSATLEGADNRFVGSLGHVAMAHDADVIAACWPLMQA
jgi:triacylglycerol esterase/lipase EstA (alpha/beta hydrolase family)